MVLHDHIKQCKCKTKYIYMVYTYIVKKCKNMISTWGGEDFIMFLMMRQLNLPLHIYIYIYI
jgi:hypothetical protein